MGTVLTSQSRQRYVRTAGLSSELLQVRPRDKAALSVSLHSPPAILPFQDDRQNVSRRNVQLIRILGKKWQVHELEEPPGPGCSALAAPALAVRACMFVSLGEQSAESCPGLPGSSFGDRQAVGFPRGTWPPNMLRLSWRPPILGFSHCSNCSFSKVLVLPQGQVLDESHSHLLLPEYPITVQVCTPECDLSAATSSLPISVGILA